MPLPSFTLPDPGWGSSWSIRPPRPAPLRGVPPAPRRLSVAQLLLSAAPPGSPEAAAAAEARLAVRSALLDLPAADRLLVELRVFHGWSAAEVAQLAAGTPEEVAERLEAILARLGLPTALVDGAVDGDEEVVA